MPVKAPLDIFFVIGAIKITYLLTYLLTYVGLCMCTVLQQYWPSDGRTTLTGRFSVTNVGPELSSDSVRTTNLKIVYEGKIKVMKCNVMTYIYKAYAIECCIK